MKDCWDKSFPEIKLWQHRASSGIKNCVKIRGKKFWNGHQSSYSSSFEFLRLTEVESVLRDSGLQAGKGLGGPAGNRTTVEHICRALTSC